MYAVRPVVLLGGLVAVYCLVPVRPEFSIPAALTVLAASIVLFVVVLVRQERRIVRATRPLMAAVEAIVILVSVFLVSFSLVYVGLSESDAGSFTEAVDKLDAVYLSVTVLTTTGFGDIAAVSAPARVAVTAHMLVNVTLLAVGVRMVTRSAQQALTRRQDARRQETGS